MALGAIIGGLATAYSAYSASKAQKREIQGQQSANQANFNFQREAWENDRHNYKHRHQWEVDDLRAANLNPILSAKFGAGGVPPSASTPSAQNPNKDQTKNTNQRTANMLSAAQLGLIQAQKQNIDADTKNKLAQSTTQGTQASLNRVKSVLANRQALTEWYNSQSAKAKYEIQKLMRDRKMTKYDAVIHWISRTADPLRGIIGGSVSQNYSTRRD